jgi:ribonuclease HI
MVSASPFTAYFVRTHGNPGPGGWGVLLRYGDVEKELCGGEATPTTNNRMELTAPIRALTALTRASIVDLHTDSTCWWSPPAT